MGIQSYMATVFMGEREISGAFKSGDFRSSLNFARRELRGYVRLAEIIYRHEVVFYYCRNLDAVTAPVLDFGILTETKDRESGLVESNFTVTATYTSEDFVSDTRAAFLAFATEDFGIDIANETAMLIDDQIASMPWYKRFEIWDCLESYDICGIATADQLIDAVRGLTFVLAGEPIPDEAGKNHFFPAGLYATR